PRPRAIGDLIDGTEPPVAPGTACESEVIANGGRDVEAGAVVLGVARAGVAEDVLVVIGHEGTAVLPLGKAGLVAVADGDPDSPADAAGGHPGAHLLVPRDLLLRDLRV